MYGSKNGWERPNWFAPEGIEAADRHGFDAANWTPHVEAEK